MLSATQDGQVDASDAVQDPRVVAALQRLRFCSETPTVVAELKRLVRDVLTTPTVWGHRDVPVHGVRIDDVVAKGGASLAVSYRQVAAKSPKLAFFLADAPRRTLALFDEVARDVVGKRRPIVLSDSFRVRITDLPTVANNLGELDAECLDQLVKVSGTVTEVSPVLSHMRVVVYDCSECRASTPPARSDSVLVVTPPPPAHCPRCLAEDALAINLGDSVCRAYQLLKVQEPASAVPKGSSPRWIRVVVSDDLVHDARMDEEVTLTGIFTRAGLAEGASMTAESAALVGVLEANFIE